MSLKKFLKFRDERDTPKPFLEHIEDLRGMVVRMAIALGICMILAFVFRGVLASFVQAPLLAVDPGRVDNLQSLGVADSMTISFKLAFYAGLVVSFPVLLYFLAEFVLPALSKKERRIVLLASIVGFGLFLGGAAFAFYAVLPAALEFFFQDAQMMQWRPTWTVGEYYSFTTQFVLAFGLAFELPVVVLALVKVGLLEHAQMQATRPYAIVVIFLLAAVITPTPDIFTLILMGAPMVLLYEACIWIARWMERRDALTAVGAGHHDRKPGHDSGDRARGGEHRSPGWGRRHRSFWAC